MPEIVSAPQPNMVQPTLASQAPQSNVAVSDPTAALAGQPPNMSALDGLAAPTGGAPTLANQNPHRTLNTVLKAVAYGLSGAAAGGEGRTVGESAAAGLKAGIGLHQQGVENQQRQDQLDQQKKESDSRIKFQSVQSAKAVTEAAMADKQLHQMDTEFQDAHNAHTLQAMKDLQALGITPTIITPNHGQGATSALEQLTESHGGVPEMHILNLGDKLVGYDLNGLNGMSNMRDQANKIGEIQGKGKEAYNSAVWGQMSPEARNSVLQQSLSFFNPMPTRENVDNMLQQYKNWKDAYAMNPEADPGTLKKLDGTISMLDQSRKNFVQQRGEEAATLARAEMPTKIAEAGAMETARLQADLKAADIDNVGMELYEGLRDPSQLSKRARTYDAELAAARRYGMAKYGKPFDIAKAQSDYKYATNPGTQNRLKYLNSLTGNPTTGDTGILDKLIEQSKKVSRTSFPGLNDAAGWVRLQSGDPEIVKLHDLMTDASEQFATIMNGGGTGSATSDAKIKLGQELFRTGFSQKQLAGSAETVRDMLSTRKREIIGDNRYLKKDFGGGTQASGGGNGGGGNGGTVRVKASDGTLHDIPSGKLDDAKKIDPTLQVVTPEQTSPAKPPLRLATPIVTPKQ